MLLSVFSKIWVHRTHLVSHTICKRLFPGDILPKHIKVLVRRRVDRDGLAGIIRANSESVQFTDLGDTFEYPQEVSIE